MKDEQDLVGKHIKCLATSDEFCILHISRREDVVVMKNRLNGDIIYFDDIDETIEDFCLIEDNEDLCEYGHVH